MTSPVSTEPHRPRFGHHQVPWTRLAVLVGGTVTMGCGLTMLLWSRLGLLPIDLLHNGVAHRFGFTFGGGVIAVQAVLLLLYLPLKITPSIGTGLGFLVPAVTVDVLLPNLPVLDNLPTRAGALIVGGLLLCGGVATYLSADLGVMPRDGITMKFANGKHAKKTRRLAWSRVVTDVIFAGTGVLLLGPAYAVHSGALSVGTVLLTVVTGPLIAVMYRLIARVPGFCAPEHGRTPA